MLICIFVVPPERPEYIGRILIVRGKLYAKHRVKTVWLVRDIASELYEDIFVKRKGMKLVWDFFGIITGIDDDIIFAVIGVTKQIQKCEKFLKLFHRFKPTEDNRFGEGICQIPMAELIIVNRNGGARAPPIILTNRERNTSFDTAFAPTGNRANEHGRFLIIGEVLINYRLYPHSLIASA
nr:MAG TPA: hypothetical protein [Caudoviricetes sp.]